MKEVVKSDKYISLHVETDGPIPGPHSMLCLSCLAVDNKGEVIGGFEGQLEPLEGAYPHPSVLEWWGAHVSLYVYCTSNPGPATKIMTEYAEWLRSLGSNTMLFGHNIVYSAMFLHWYAMKFSKTPTGYLDAIDIRSFYMGRENNIPNRPYKGPAVPQRPIDAAMGQVIVFRDMLGIKDSE